MILSKEDEVIYKLIKDEQLNAKQLSIRLKISKKAVYKHLNRLKEKGLVEGTAYRGIKIRGGVSGGGGKNQPDFPMELRLHNQQWKLQLSGRIRNIKPLKLHGVSICFYGSTSTLQQTKEISFYGNTTEECYQKSRLFWDNFFTQFEDRFNIKILMKERTHIGEIAEIASGFAKATENESLKIVVRDDGGKRRLITDLSLNRHETETVHPEKSKDDANLFMQDILKGWLNGDVMTPRQQQRVISDVVVGIRAFEDRALKPLTAQIQLHLEVQRETLSTLKQMQETMKRQRMKDVDNAYFKEFKQEWW